MNPVLRQVDHETAKKFADSNNLKFEETSAVTNKSVNDVFDNLLHYIYEVKAAQEANGSDLLEGDSKKFKKLTEFTSPDEEPKKKGCC
jgi:uncharacterized protein (DUF2141 family)